MAMHAYQAKCTTKLTVIVTILCLRLNGKTMFVTSSQNSTACMNNYFDYFPQTTPTYDIFWILPIWFNAFCFYMSHSHDTVFIFYLSLIERGEIARNREDQVLYPLVTKQVIEIGESLLYHCCWAYNLDPPDTSSLYIWLAVILCWAATEGNRD